MIFAVSSAVPPYRYTQDELAENLINILSLNKEKADFFNRIYKNSFIKARYSVLNDFQKPRSNWTFFDTDYPNKVPGMSARNHVYKSAAPLLAEKSARQVIEKWGGDPAHITHLISVSCTGMIAPGIEYQLMHNIGLSRSVNRLGINYMGCFGAFKGLSVAEAFARANPDARILLVCTELCSLHIQADDDLETLTANSLFSDGSAAAIIGGNCSSKESPMWEIYRTHSLGFENSLDAMTWEPSDRGMLMTLSHKVPILIKRTIKKFAEQLLPKGMLSEQFDWAIHPGGGSILQAVEKSLGLQPDQTDSSWRVLSDFGNMSSATFLFVLEELSKKLHQRSWTAGIGFGPGLSVEGIVLQKTV